MSSTLSVAVGGSLRPRSGASGVEFLGARHEIVARYGALSAVDAAGHRLVAALRMSGGHVLITVNDRGARYPITIDPLVQQGAKLAGGGEAGLGSFGASVALSTDGNTAVVGGDTDNANSGAAWVFTRSGGTWSQQGAKLTPSDATSAARFGSSVALSADGNTALVGAFLNDANSKGRSGCSPAPGRRLGAAGREAHS